MNFLNNTNYILTFENYTLLYNPDFLFSLGFLCIFDMKPIKYL